ncbi:hypothetical protein [Flagellimonas myxillae]|uniref:hypothetical protein n=1 Tax=Flagellimonas myxillae TaxID=2942214 RepID=UPI00201FB08E|nr:hypothetical protein [Muricauda myxillae]MCL6264946.1 hypothetical protein [Muricauda myxillae]
MKNFKMYVLLALGIFIAGCSEDDKVSVLVQDTVTSGAILRTLSATGALDMFDTASTLAFSIQEQDAEGGALLDRVEITASFVDNNGADNSVANAALATIASSEFGETDGLPSFDYSVTMAEVLSATGVALTEVLPGDQFVIDMELFLTDGRSFKNSDTTGNVSGGSFFSSPYQYTELVDDGIAFDIEDVNANEVSLTNPNMDYSVAITIDDGNDQALLATLNLYRAFVDRSIVDDINASEPEELFATWNIADLDIEDGVSSLDYEITLDDLYGPNLTFDDLGVNDEFQLRYEIVTADGRVVTTDENDTEYYRAVFVTECIQLNADAPYPGEYTINHFDSYGDGWNGASIDVTIDGGDTVSYTLENGENGTSTFTVPEGATSLVIAYSSGDWESEVSYTIQDPNLKTAASDGPFPAVGEITILVCE